jgi:hypothetical protein
MPTDPTKKPEFERVIRHFVATPHKPHSPLGTPSKTKRGSNATPKDRKGSKDARATATEESK